MKKIAVGVALIFGFTLLQPINAQAANESIVIIDTAIDTSIPVLKNKVIYEACFVESGTCANGKTSAEGSGTATMPSLEALSNGFEHGTIMALIANQINPDVNIIFIRVAGKLSNGRMGTFSADRSITQALNWVVENKNKYNIVSVSSSVATSMAALNTGNNYCPIRSVHNTLINNIDKLSSMGVPVMFPSGNNRDNKRIVFPACIPQAVAVGGATEDDSIPQFFNAGDLVDFYTLAYYNTQVKRAIGTSGATVALSAYWAQNYKGSYQATYDYLKSISKPVTGFVTKGFLVDLTN